MLWVGWRQQRSETLITAAFLVGLVALLLPTGLQMAGAYDDGGLSHCLGSSADPACRAAIDAFAARFAKLGDLLAWMTILPGVIGVLLAAPLVQQLEHRTYRLDWTQSITRGRWLAGKLGLAVATAVVAAVALTLLITWWRAPWVRLQGRMENSVFDSEGTVVVGYTLFALGLAAAIGAVWRRAVPSLILGFAGYFAVRLFVDTSLRQQLMHPVSTTWAADGREPDLGRAWVLDRFPADAHGHPLPFIACPGNGVCAMPVETKVSFWHAVYHPASHFWSLQIRETVLFAGMAVVLLAFAAWWTHRRAM
jgi:hypothetical protein